MARSIPVLGWVVFSAIVLGFVLMGSLFTQYIAGLAMIYAASALGLDWIQGRAGQVSIGSAAFMAIGAYVAATAAGAGVPFLAALLLACLAGATVGLIFGLPALRLRGLYLALSTLALQFITSSLALQYETVSGKSAGFFVPPATIGPFQLQQGRAYTLFLALALALVAMALRNLYTRAPGRAWLAIKENEMAAAVIGLNPTRWKLVAFLGSSALISLSGALLAFYTLRVFSDTFSLQFALTFVVMVIVGGLGSIPGVILGAVVVTISPYVLSGITGALPESLPITSWLENNIYYINNGLYGVLVLVFLLFQPRGIAGTLDDAGQWFNERVQRKRAGVAVTTVPSTPVPTRIVAVGNESQAILRVRDLRLVYRTGASALDGIDLDVGAGEIVALLGRNGAGKTSTLRAISGFFVADKVSLSGSIVFNGRSVLGSPPTATAAKGFILVPERDKVFPSLTVTEHLRLCGKTPTSTRARIASVFPVLSERGSSPAGLLSGGERQMLALAMAWCMEPRLLLIDELSLGLAPAIVKRLMATVREFRDTTGVPVLLVEQNVSAALEVADRAYVLEAGRIVSSGTCAEISRESVLSSSSGR
jgi:branched-chain amino acid transport system permease protein